MDPEDEIQTDWPPYFRQYKSGRVERLMGTAVIPASVDPATGVISKDVPIDAENGVSARLYLPPDSTTKKKLPILVYYHGGGFCIESAFSPTYNPFLNSLASKANLLVVSVDYRLAPEHKLPAAYDDSWTALKWVFSLHADPWIAEHGDLDRVYLAGDSAGANISHQMAMRAGVKSHEEEAVKIEGIILIHPYFWGSEPLESETRDPSTRAWLAGLWKLVSSPGMDDLDDPRSNPIARGARSLAAGLGCGRVLVCVAEEDPMVERGKAYYEALKAGGWNGEVELFESEGEGHVFHLDKPESGKAPELIERVVDFLK